MHPVSHNVWAMRMGVKELLQEAEQLFQHFMCFGQFVFNQRESCGVMGVILLFVHCCFSVSIL